jgi:hypothetical protein
LGHLTCFERKDLPPKWVCNFIWILYLHGIYHDL